MELLALDKFEKLISKKLECKMKTKFIQHSNVGIYYVQNIRYAKIRVPKGKVFIVKDVEVWYLLIMIHVYVNYVIGT
jgi:hypothetical protein